MSVQQTTPKAGRRTAMKRTERQTPEDTLRRIIEEHKKDMGETVWLKIDDRTHIEVGASLTEDERNKRVENYLENIGRR